MAKKRKSAGIILETLKDYIRELPILKAVGLDRRSVARSRRVTRELAEYKPSVVARELGISTQKYTALKRIVEKGKIASPALSEVLENVGRDLRTNITVARTGDYIADNGRHYKINYRQASTDFIKSKMKFATSIKPGGFADLQSALNWLGGVTGGAEYFWLARDNNGRYFVYDVRTASEKNNKGGAGGSLKANAIFDKYGVDEIRKSKPRRKSTHVKKGTARTGRKGKR